MEQSFNAMDRMREIPCPANTDGCKYAPNCHLSEHHLYPRRTADTRLKRDFGNLAINKVISCRNIHDLLDTLPAPAYPSPEEMRRKIDERTEAV